jgi:hypothetical protein
MAIVSLVVCTRSALLGIAVLVFDMAAHEFDDAADITLCNSFKCSQNPRVWSRVMPRTQSANQMIKTWAMPWRVPRRDRPRHAQGDPSVMVKIVVEDIVVGREQLAVAYFGCVVVIQFAVFILIRSRDIGGLEA